MSPLCRRIHYFEINDEAWFPQYLREKVQSCLSLAWTFKVPILQKASPAQLVASTLYRVLGDSVQDYTYVDFCAGAGGPTPFIEQDLNAKLALRSTEGLAETVSNGTKSPGTTMTTEKSSSGPVRFILTDLHPHLHDWSEAAVKSSNLGFVSTPVDASNAPHNLTGGDGKKVFRLFNLAFHHFEDPVAKEILRNTIETADGFGIYELQERTYASLFTIFLMGLLFLLITPIYFWRSPGHLFYTYIIPILPFTMVHDGCISSLRTRTAEEVQALMKECGVDCDDWVIKSGREQHTYPTGYMTWVMGIKKTETQQW